MKVVTFLLRVYFLVKKKIFFHPIKMFIRFWRFEIVFGNNVTSSKCTLETEKADRLKVANDLSVNKAKRLSRSGMIYKKPASA